MGAGNKCSKKLSRSTEYKCSAFDSEANVVYIKSADASGMPSIKILDYNVRDSEPRKAESAPQTDFVTHNELADIQREIDSLKAKFERSADKRNGGKNDGK